MTRAEYVSVNDLLAEALSLREQFKTVDPNRIDFPSELFSEGLY